MWAAACDNPIKQCKLPAVKVPVPEIAQHYSHYRRYFYIVFLLLFQETVAKRKFVFVSVIKTMMFRTVIVITFSAKVTAVGIPPVIEQRWLHRCSSWAGHLSARSLLRCSVKHSLIMVLRGEFWELFLTLCLGLLSVVSSWFWPQPLPPSLSLLYFSFPSVLGPWGRCGFTPLRFSSSSCMYYICSVVYSFK